MKDILIVDDDTAIANLIADALEDEGFHIRILNDGESALKEIKESEFELIILDIMMPKMDGLTLCRKIRDRVSCPILFLTAKNRMVDTLVGLEMGADDYISKPFVVEELVARVKAHIRREHRETEKAKDATIKFDTITINKESYEVYKNRQPIELSHREFQILCYFIENSGKVLSKEQIFDAVWGPDYGDIGTVAVNIKNLRSKLDPNNEYLKTVWGVGYKLVIPQRNVL
jgi:DNA-binding response OmpR family regulator